MTARLGEAVERGRRGGVFPRLVASYIILVAAATLATALSAYLFFQGKFNRELESVHDYIIHKAEREAETKVLETSAGLYMECASRLERSGPDFFGGGDALEGNAYKVFATCQYLRDLAYRDIDRVSAIHIYYRAAGLVISSATGLLGPSAGAQIGASWIETLESAEGGHAWVLGEAEGAAYSGDPSAPSDPSAPGSGPYARELRSYPILSGPSDCDAVIAIDFSRAALGAIIAGPPSSGTGLSLLIGGSGQLIASSEEVAWTPELEAAALRAARLASAEGKGGDRFETIGGKRSLVSALRMPNSDWLLVNITPSAILYSRGDSLRFGLLGIWIAAILAGAALALVVGSRIYGPLGRLMTRVKGLSGVAIPPLSEAGDEYRLLDYAIGGLSARTEELDRTLQRNRPMIKHELMSRLIGGEATRAEELEAALRDIGAPELEGPCAAAIAFLDYPGGARAEDVRILKYSLAEALELEGRGAVIVATLMDASLGVIADLRGAEIEGLAASWAEAAKGRFGIEATICAGSQVAGGAMLGASFREASALAEYRFFFPELRLLSAKGGLLDREGRSGALPEGTLDSLAQALRLRSARGFDDGLARLSAFVRSDAASAERCRMELTRVVNLVADLGAELLPPGAQAFRERVLALPAAARNIEALQSALSAEAASLIAALDERSEERSSLLVERAKEFVGAHLGEELSLDRVSEAIGLSPSYLSKVFKEVAGESFVAYVTEARLAKAEVLLAEGEASVQEVGRFVGFNGSAYFIKQFKARFGATPIDYRRQNAHRRVKGE